MKLISEEIQDAEYLVEETNGKKAYKIRGVFLQSDIKNRNGRIYENSILSNEVKRYTTEYNSTAARTLITKGGMQE